MGKMYCVCLDSYVKLYNKMTSAKDFKCPNKIGNSEGGILCIKKDLEECSVFNLLEQLIENPL